MLCVSPDEEGACLSSLRESGARDLNDQDGKKWNHERDSLAGREGGPVRFIGRSADSSPSSDTSGNCGRRAQCL